MNEHNYKDAFRNLEPPLDSAVRAVLTEPIPADAVQRVISQAKELETQLAVRSSLADRASRQSLKLPERRIATWSALAAAVAALLFLSFLLFPLRASIAWAELVEAIRERPWVHGTTTYSNGKQSGASEFWISNARKIAAFKFGKAIQFNDLENDITLKYDLTEGTLLRVPRLTLGDGQFQDTPLMTLLDSLIDEDINTQNLFYGEQLVIAQRKRIEDGGQPWLEYLIHLRRIDNRSLQRTLRIRLDPDTRLPSLWEERYVGGIVAVTRFDYPPNGPMQIYDLGVPRTAKLIDRVPSDVLARIDQSLKADRQQFDDYDAIVVQQTEGVPTSIVDPPMMNLNIRRVRRSGNRHRIDQLVLPKPGLSEPEQNGDIGGWWQRNRDRFWSVPVLVSDGKHVFFYRMLDGRIVPGEQPNLSVVLTAQSPVRMPTDDPPVEWPQWMPDQCARPHLWIADERHLFDIEANATERPTATVRVVISQRKDELPRELFRYWFDPERDFVVQKSVVAVFERDADDIAYRDSQEFGDFAQSPSGKWFPRRVEHTTTNPENPNWKGITRFYVDFDANVPDELFQPEATDP